MNVKLLVRVAVLSAIGVILSLVSVPIPIFPSFLEISIADVPGVFGAMMLGPIPAVIIEFIRSFTNMVFLGSYTGGVGELADFLMGSALVIPVGILFQKQRNDKNFYIGASLGIIFMAIAGCVLNYLLLLPVYAKVMSVPVQSFVDMSTAIFPFIDTMPKFLLFTIAPYNILKGGLVFLISYFLYKVTKKINF